MSSFPVNQGLYDSNYEKDSCGVGIIANILGKKSHEIIQNALTVLVQLNHRGAQSVDPLTGDGAGILTQIPHLFFLREAAKLQIELPGMNTYGVGMFFLPRESALLERIEATLQEIANREGFRILGWRTVPRATEILGTEGRQTEPQIRQCFVVHQTDTPPLLEDKLFELRLKIENAVGALTDISAEEFYILSFSSRTIVYKGLLRPDQLPRYYPDLTDPDFVSALAMVHSRFSTNTFPSWSLAHPFRYSCHNGEINTIRGNLNWMNIRQTSQSDSAHLDQALERLVMAGYSLPHALLRLMPEPWIQDSAMSEKLRAFYQYQSLIMEPWDGPALVGFTDGRYVGAHLDRNGLRPCRYHVTDDHLLVLASEAGVLPCDPEKIKMKGRLKSGQILMVDTLQGYLREDQAIKKELSEKRPYKQWVSAACLALDDFPEPTNRPDIEKRETTPLCPDSLLRLQHCFCFTREEINSIVLPMALQGEEPISSMGNDTPLAVLSEKPQLLFKYFKQMFAQVTNPPMDPIREQSVMSLITYIGAKPESFQEGPMEGPQLRTLHPILSNRDLEKIRGLPHPSLQSKTLSLLFTTKEGPIGLKTRLQQLCEEAATATRQGYPVLILSDRGVNVEKTTIPSLLGLSAVHQHLIRESLRSKASLILESGEPREVHHFACLLGFGANLINPYLTFEIIQTQTLTELQIDKNKACAQYISAINKGLLKVLSKMGISTLQSYCGAQLFEAIGIHSTLINDYFTGTSSRIEGMDLGELSNEILKIHTRAYRQESALPLDYGGDIHYRIQGEHHHWNPETIASLQRASQQNSTEAFKEFSNRVNQSTTHLPLSKLGESHRRPSSLRDLLQLNLLSSPLNLTEIESAQSIVKRFTTGAMSFGALGKEAHETLAVAMNRIDAKSNSGEGGEDPERFNPMPNGDWKNSAIKQIASARFGVTTHYLVHAKELQIKMAQGAKPGEGGQLPGHKVDETIAKLRHSTPGLDLISPPPHHDIYSIEDLAQLIFDLKNVNPVADVSVKLVAECGVGTIAVGVAKAHADKILISGDSGGTGASSLSSIKNAGIPWELGLSEVHQTLVLNQLRDRVKLETDGQLKTGRDVVIAALLGADEFGFSTAPLIVQGCIMMRKCHLNTCPVGIATQDPILRKKFTGQPEHVINYFFLVAEEVREWMSKLGFRRFSEMIGSTEKIDFKSPTECITKKIDLAPLLYKPKPSSLKWDYVRNSFLISILDRQFIELSQPAIKFQEQVHIHLPIQNTNRSTGAMLSGEVVRQHGPLGLPPDCISIHLQGSAGQSFGAFLASGITLVLEGESNDYTGKGLSGGKIIIFPPRKSQFKAEDTVLIGNTSLYGATQGQVFLNGLAGERFGVRNSGAQAVVEGVGDHGCEYMTGGIVVILGKTGNNFGAGMSGGIAYVLDEDGSFQSNCNLTMIEVDQIQNEEDLSLLKAMIEDHLNYTSSQKASKILQNWEEFNPLFKKVTPIQLKRKNLKPQLKAAPVFKHSSAIHRELQSSHE